MQKAKLMILGALLLGTGLVVAGCGTQTNNMPQTNTPAPANQDQAAVEGVKVTALTDGAYKIDATASRLGWHSKKMLVTDDRTGTVAIKDGSLEIKDGKLAGGAFTIDMSTIHDNATNQSEAMVEKHLKSPDFFDAAKYPTAALKITSVVPGANNDYQVTGDLTIKATTKPVTFTATVTGTETGLTAAAKFTIDRSQWDVRYGSGTFFQNLGDKIITNDIDYDVALVATK